MSYTLITGASGGIGKEFAYFYAAKKKNLILVARSLDTLNEIKDDLMSQYGIEVKVFGFDLTQLENIDRVMQWVRENNIPVDTLINNAGVCEGGELALLGKEKVSTILDLNIKALVYFCHQVIPLFKENKKGRILNIASMAAYEPCPYYALYFASKAFVLSFTESIRIECKPYHIGVSAVCPGFVETNMTQNLPDMGMSLAKPQTIVRLGDKLLRKDRAVGVNGFGNNILIFLVKIIPRSFLRMFMTRLVKIKFDRKKKEIIA
jgi:short-subunit dehydrogenase